MCFGKRWRTWGRYIPGDSLHEFLLCMSSLFMYLRERKRGGGIVMLHTWCVPLGALHLLHSTWYLYIPLPVQARNKPSHRKKIMH